MHPVGRGYPGCTSAARLRKWRQKGKPTSLVLNLPPELEAELAAEAAHYSLSLPEYVLRLLARSRNRGSGPRMGEELVAYWREEGPVGTRSEITNAPSHARALREQAQRRQRP